MIVAALCEIGIILSTKKGAPLGSEETHEHEAKHKEQRTKSTNRTTETAEATTHTTRKCCRWII